MEREEVYRAVEVGFSDATRPEMFVRGSCRCEECMEHESEMQSFDPLDLPLEKLDNPGWDPICFASNEAWSYLMPGLVRLVFEHPSAYIDQFTFHVGQPERLNALTAEQARALEEVLNYLLLHEPRVLEENRVVDELLQTVTELRRIGSGR